MDLVLGPSLVQELADLLLVRVVALMQVIDVAFLHPVELLNAHLLAIVIARSIEVEGPDGAERPFQRGGHSELRLPLSLAYLGLWIRLLLLWPPFDDPARRRYLHLNHSLLWFGIERVAFGFESAGFGASALGSRRLLLAYLLVQNTLASPLFHR